MVAYKLRGSKGFTLIEIIVVLVILAILMVVIVPSVMSYINEGNDARYEAVARTALINTQTAIAKDYGENGSLKGKNCVDAAIWIENCKAGNVSDARREGVQARFGSARSYGTHVKLWVTNITLNSSGDDLASAQYYISLDGKYNTYRKVDVTVNGKILVGKTNENSYTPATKYK